MKQPARILSGTCLVLLCGVAAMPLCTFAQQPPVLAQDLQKVRATGKVLAALWTVRSDSYTLQLVLPVTTTATPQPGQGRASRLSSGATAPNQPARVQVWLLREDGTQVLPTRQSPAPTAATLGCVRCVSYEFWYSFPLAAGREAVAAAVRINDDFYIEQLKPLGN